MGWARPQRWETVALAAVVAGGVVARSWQLGCGFSNDEISSVLVAGGSFRDFVVGALHDAPHPPLYYFVLHLWLSVFGTSEVAARSLSLVFSVGFLLAGYKLLRRSLEPPLALALLCVFAFGSYFVLYGQQARAYGLIALVAALNLLAFLRAMEAPNAGAVRLWAASCVALVFSQYMGVLFIATEVVWAVVKLRRNGVPFVWYGAAAGLSVVAWLIAAMGAAVAHHHDPIPTTNWMTAPAWADFVWFYGTLFGTAVQLRWLFLVIGVLVAFFAVRAWRTRALPADFVFLALVAIGVPLLTFALSRWGPRPVFVPRQLMGAAVAAVAALAMVLSAVPRSLARSGAALLALLCLVALPQARPAVSNEPWRSVATWADHAYGPARVVIADLSDRHAFAYYSRSVRAIALRDLGDRRTDAFLIVCRPRYCRLEDDVRARTDLVRTWQWGTTGTLLVYRVHSATPTQTASLKPAP